MIKAKVRQGSVSGEGGIQRQPKHTEKFLHITDCFYENEDSQYKIQKILRKCFNKIKATAILIQRKFLEYIQD